MFMDMSSEMIHSLLPVFLVSVLGVSALSVGFIVSAVFGSAATGNPRSSPVPGSDAADSPGLDPRIGWHANTQNPRSEARPPAPSLHESRP
jgi:hypothetical protein